MAEPLPFEQRPDESAQAFAAFAVYRDMQADRSLAHVAQKHGKSIATLTKWSTKHNWVARARSYDAALDARARLATEKQAILQRREMLAAHADEARSLRRIAKQIIDDFERRFNEKVETLKWVPSPDFLKLVLQLPKILETAQQLERLATGEMPTNLEPPKPPEDMTNDELDAYIKLLQRAIA